MPATDNRKRLLLVAPRFSYRIAAYIQAAKQLGVTLLIASDGKNSLVSELAQGLHVNFDDIETTLGVIKTQHQLHPFDAILATDDRTVAIAAQAATELNLACNPTNTAQISRRKDLSRKTLADGGISVPTHHKIKLSKADTLYPQMGFPCVIKPLSMSASTGVIRANDAQEFKQACTDIQNLIAHLPDHEEKTYALVEQYVEGTEVAVEGLVQQGQFELLAIIDKPEPLTGPYFEESYYTTPSRLDKSTQHRIIESVKGACHVMGIVTGPVHAELRVNAEHCWVIEVATRSIGGDCSKILQFIYAKSLEEMVIRNALGFKSADSKSDFAAGVMMIPTPTAGILRRVEGTLKAEAITFIESVEIAVHPGHELIKLPQGSSYLGFIFAKARTAHQVEQALRQAYGCLRIVIAPLFVRINQIK